MTAAENTRSVKTSNRACIPQSFQIERSRMNPNPTAYHSAITARKMRRSMLLRSTAVIASPTATRKVRMRMRTLPSHVNHVRSTNSAGMVHRVRRMIPLGAFPFWFESHWKCCGPPVGGPSWGPLSGELCDHREQRHIQRDHDAADGYAEGA